LVMRGRCRSSRCSVEPAARQIRPQAERYKQVEQRARVGNLNTVAYRICLEAFRSCGLTFVKMPVKLITSDAKGFLKKAIGELAEALGKIPPRHTYAGSVYYSDEKLKKAAEQLENVRSLFEDWLFTKALWNESNESPKLIRDPFTGSNGDWNSNRFHNAKIRGKLILFKNALFDVTGLYTPEEAKLLVQKNYEAERSEIDFLKSRSGKSSSKSETGREHIPERIKNEVWRRDGGKCVECGSVYNLEFDHVIPVAKGGSNTARNLRILCEPCNRRKSARIG